MTDTRRQIRVFSRQVRTQCIARVFAAFLFASFTACAGRQDVSTPSPLTTGWSTTLDHLDHHSWSAHVDGSRLHLTAIEGAETGLRVVRVQPGSGIVLWQTDVAVDSCLQPELASSADTTAVACDADVFALEASTGRITWQARTGDDALVDRLALGNDVVVASRAEGGADVFDRADGRRIDDALPSDGYVVLLAERDGDVFAVTHEDEDGDATLVVWRMDATSTRLWSMRVSGGGEPPFLVDDLLFARDLRGDLLGHALRSGRVATEPWQPGAIGTRVGALRLEQEEVAGVILTLRRLDAWGPGDDDPRWSTHLVANRDLSPILPVAEHHALLVGSGDRYHLLDARTGRLRWSATVDDALSGDGCGFGGTDGRAVFVVCSGIDASSVTAVPTEPPSSR